MKCFRCGNQQSPLGRYCGRCGSLLVPSRKKERNNKRGRSPNKSTYFIAGALIITCAVVISMLVTRNESDEYGRPGIADSRVFNESVLEIASKFYCPCGGCTNHPLDQCTCTHARGSQETRQAIAAQLNAGKSYLETVQFIQSQYGSLKPEFK